MPHPVSIRTNAPAERVYDCIGVGFGPSNVALAVALEELDLLDNVVFLEARGVSGMAAGNAAHGQRHSAQSAA